MMINTNSELRNAVNDAIKESGITKTALASKVGLTRQGLDKLLQKQSFSIDDANKLLNVIHITVNPLTIRQYRLDELPVTIYTNAKGQQATNLSPFGMYNELHTLY